MPACRWAEAVAEANIEAEPVPAGTDTSRPSHSSAPPAVPRIHWPDLQRSMPPVDTSGPGVAAAAAELVQLVKPPAELLEVASWSSAVVSVAEYRPAAAGPAFALIVRSLADGTADDMEHPVAVSR